MDSLHSSRVETRWGYSAEQLEAIKLFGRKDLKEGCIISTRNNIIGTFVKKEPLVDALSYQWIWIKEKEYPELLWEILWHIPHLSPDLFRVGIEKWFHVSLALQSRWEYVLSIYGSETQNFYTYNPTLPLLDQPSLPEIINLFKNG